MIESGQIVIDPERYLVTVAGESVRLTFMEFNALRTIAELDGRIARYDQLSKSLWGENSYKTRRRLAVLMSRLRAKLGPDAGPRLETVKRVGYRLAEAAA